MCCDCRSSPLHQRYSGTLIIRHSVGSQIVSDYRSRLLDYGVTLTVYFNMVTVPHKMVELVRMSDYRDVGLSSDS